MARELGYAGGHGSNLALAEPAAVHNPGRGAVYCHPAAEIPKPEALFGAGSEQYDGRSAHLGLSSAHMLEPNQPNRAVDIIGPKLMAMNSRTMGLGAEVLSVNTGALQKTKGPSNRRSPMSTENPQSLREILRRCSPNLVSPFTFLDLVFI